MLDAMRFIQFTPLYQERVWGGHALAEKLNRELPAGRPIGESWEIVDRPEAQSVISNGPGKGLSLRGLLQQDSEAIMGPGWDAAKPFPILVKWLDCQERLSLQVHPPAQVAAELGGEPKTENWFVADCKKDAAILVGLKDGVSRNDFEQALHDEELEPLVQRIPTVPGLSMFVFSGRIHAIDAGNLILEIQQNSDTTYRVYDWGRLGLDGKPRQLHIKESLKSIDFEDFEPKPILPQEGDQALARSEVFNLDKRSLKKGESLALEKNEEPRLIGLVKGSLVDSEDAARIEHGRNVLLPYSESFTFTAEEDCLAVITSGFAQ